MGVVILKPSDPEAKGLVERANGYLETSFLPGRRFSSPADFNSQLGVWLEKANNRVHRTLRCRPLDRLAEDRQAMMAFPPVLPDPAQRLSVRLPRDHWVRVGSCDYSVHPKAIGRLVEVWADPTEVVVTLVGKVVGRHRRSYARHRTITDPAHVLAGQAMRAASAALGQETRDGSEVEVRDLSVYDRALGVV